MPIYRFLTILFLTASLFFTGAKPAESAQCSYFNETFTGTASNTWSFNNGTWAIKSDLLNVTAITGNGYAYASSSFSPASYFTMDVAAGVVSLASANGAFGFYIYTTGTNYLSVDGKSLEGVAVDVWPDNTATLSGWDVNAKQWHMSSKLPIQPANFIGLEFSAGAVTLRLDKQSTSLKFSTSISAPSAFNKIDLYAQGSGFITGGTSINFDNICADPLPTPVVSTGTVTLASPADGATSQSVTPTLSWSATGSPTAYRIFAATDENTLKNLSTDATTCSGCVVTANTGTTTSYTFASGTLQTGTKYYWRVKAGYSGGNVLSDSTWSFTTAGSGGGGGSSCTATIDQALKLNIPVIKYTDQLLGNIYLWADMDYVLNPSKVLFKLKDYGMIQNVSGYTCAMSTIDSDLTIHVADLSYGGASYWLKLSLDSGLSSGNNLYFKAADYGTGTGGGGTTNTVTLISPTNGATSQSLMPTLSWSATGSPTAYRIFVATDESTLNGLSSEATTCSGCVLTTNTSTTASYTFSSGTLQPETKYYWRVKAGYSSGSVLSGDIWSFTTATASSVPYGAFDAKKFVDSLFMGKITVMNMPLGVIPALFLTVDNPEQIVDLMVTAMPTMITKITNGVKFDFGKGYYLPGGNRLEGSISLTYSNIVKAISMNYAISFTSFSHNFGYKTDGSVSGAMTSDNNGTTMTLGGNMYSSTGDVAVSGNAQYIKSNNCTAGYPTAGSLDFVSSSKKEKISFTKNCDGTYDYTTY